MPDLSGRAGRRMLAAWIYSLMACLLWPVALAVAADAPALLTTPDGALAGVERDGLRLFAGIPYAQPPVGMLRWRPPRQVRPWTGVRDASRPGPDCVQQAIFWRPGAPASLNEDCLALNVYAPAAAGEGRPVLVWFHGGGWVNGAATDAQPRRLAGGGQVVVTVNYRLGALGYLAHPSLDAETPDNASSGTYGDLDKVEALRWVRRNIAAFGGDPARVTIAGQSAGAGAVCWLMASPRAKGLFARAIIQSIGDCPTLAHADATARGASFAAALGCADGATAGACLRAKTPAELVAAQIGTGLPWRPVAGGADEPVPPLAAFRTGAFAQVPVLVGATRHEARAFVYENHDRIAQPLTGEGLEAEVRRAYREKAGAVLAAYPLSAGVAPGAALAAAATDALFACPTVPLVAALATWVPTYAYEFRDETAPPRPYMSVPSSFPIGSGHTADVPYVWDTETAAPLTAPQMTLSRVMMDDWSAFAATGNPNRAGTPDWPRAEPVAPRRIGFGTAGALTVIEAASYAQDHHCDLWLPQ